MQTVHPGTHQFEESIIHPFPTLFGNNLLNGLQLTLAGSRDSCNWVTKEPAIGGAFIKGLAKPKRLVAPSNKQVA